MQVDRLSPYDGLLGACASLQGAAVSDGAFSRGPAVWVGTREIAHVEGDGRLDVRLTRGASVRDGTSSGPTNG